MQNGEKISAKLARKLSVQQESLSDAPRITVSGTSSVVVEGHRGLLEYGPEQVSAAGKGCRVIIRGEGLHLVSMNETELAVAGRLWAVELL